MLKPTVNEWMQHFDDTMKQHIGAHNAHENQIISIVFNSTHDKYNVCVNKFIGFVRYIHRHHNDQLHHAIEYLQTHIIDSRFTQSANYSKINNFLVSVKLSLAS